MTRPEDEPVRVAVQPVSARVHAGRLGHAQPLEPLDGDGADEPVLEREASRAIVPLHASRLTAVALTVLPTVTVVALLAVGASWLDALLAGAGVLATLVLHHVASGLPFGFGHGFVGYLPDDGWPHGVQEDDDFHWSWDSRDAGSSRRPSTGDREAGLPVGRPRALTPSAGHQR